MRPDHPPNPRCLGSGYALALTDAKLGGPDPQRLYPRVERIIWPVGKLPPVAILNMFDTLSSAQCRHRHDKALLNDFDIRRLPNGLVGKGAR